MKSSLLEMLIKRSRGTPPVPPTPSIPTDYVFYATLSEDLDDESQYQRTMTLTSGTATYGTVDGIASVLVPGNSVLKSDDFSGITSGDHSHAISVWQKFSSIPSTGYGAVFGFGNAGTSHGIFAAAIYQGGYYLTTWGFDGPRVGTVDTEWHHLLLNHDSTTGSYDLYIDGVLADSQTSSSALNLSSTGYIFLNGAMKSNGSTDVKVTADTRYRNARIYDRALNSAEIALLASELTPTRSVVFDDQTASFFGTTQGTKTLEATPSGCTFAVTSGTLPSGVTLSSAGVLTYDGSGISTTQTVQVVVTASKTGYVSDTATISITMTAAGGVVPSDYVFLHTLESGPTLTAETGQAMTLSGSNASQTTLGGVSCTAWGGSTRLYTTDVTGLPSGSHAFTESVWVYRPSSNSADQTWMMMGTSNNGTNKYEAHLKQYNNYAMGGFWYGDVEPRITVPTETWTHYLQTYDGTTCVLYQDGTQIGSRTVAGNITYGEVSIGGASHNSIYLTGGAGLRNVMIYDRVLTLSEIADIYSAGPTFAPSSS